MVSILEAKKTIELALMEIEEVIGVGLSREKNEIIVYLIYETNETKTKIPDYMSGFKVRTEVIGMITPSTDILRIGRRRPVIGGISTGHYEFSTGTIACIVRDATTKEPMVLSNNHDFADESTNYVQRVHVGDGVIQPGRADGGGIFGGSNTDDVIGNLSRWINFDEDGQNIADCAVAKLSVEAVNAILGNNEYQLVVRGLKTITNGISVEKYGRTTGHTIGTIVDADFSCYVGYSGKWILFVDQILVQMNIAGGDSGSLLMDRNGNAVGLDFARADGGNGVVYCIANKINSVFSLLDIELASGENQGDDYIEPEPISGNLPLIGCILFAGTAVAALLSGMTRNTQ